MKNRRLLILAALILAIIGLVLWHNQSASAPSGGHDNTKSATNTPPVQNTPTFDKTAYSTTDPASIWIVVNKQHPLNPKDYAPTDLTTVGNGQYMRAEAATALTNMLADAKAAGFAVIPASGYRSYITQVNVYNNEVKINGQAYADTESARPGYSEHQTGWAIDLGSGGCNITDCFGTTQGGQWITANAYKYGFLLRYTPDKVNITGYRAEAWHFRFIGVPLATEMHNQGIETLEEFFNITGGTAYN